MGTVSLHMTTSDDNTDDNTPEIKIPDENTPDDNTPDDNTSEDNTPDDNTPFENTPDVIWVLSSGCCHLRLLCEVTRSPFYLFIENFIHSGRSSSQLIYSVDIYVPSP
jgi:hypothetical protein